MKIQIIRKIKSQNPCEKGDDSDVGDIVMLVTLWWWLIWDVGGRIIMLPTFYVGDFFNVLNRSPISQTYHEHIWSPTM